MSVPTLYCLCLDYLKEHTNDITSLEGIQFTIIETILDHLFTSNTPLNTAILSVVGDSHGENLRKAQLDWTCINLCEASVTSAIPSFMVISQHFPKFITCLNLDNCNLYDKDILLLRGFCNLTSLGLGNNNITDQGLTLFVNIATSIMTGGIPYLESLNLSQLYITDKSLKFITKLTLLKKLDISNTNITSEVAIRYLATRGFTLMKRNMSLLKSNNNSKFYLFIKTLSLDYQHAKQPLVYQKTSTTSLLYFERDRQPTTPLPTTTSTIVQARPKVTKKRKLTTNDFLSLVESELFND